MPRRRGRGAAENPANTYEKLHVILDPGELEEEELRRVPTQFFRDTTKSIFSVNSSPDIPFTHSINPYRGCEHGCIYCLSGDTPILMSDGTRKPLGEVAEGDEIFGTERRGHYRHYKRTRVLAHWRTTKPAYKITLADGTEIVSSADHRFLTERGWKFVTGTGHGSLRRPFLTTNNSLMGMGAFAVPPEWTRDYRRGYLTGMIRGDGHLRFYPYEREGRAHGHQYHFRLALTDEAALLRTADFLRECGVQTQKFMFQHATDTGSRMKAIRTHARSNVEAIQQIIGWPEQPGDAWFKGFLAGAFDAEGSYGDVLRISNSDPGILHFIERGLLLFGFSYAYDTPRKPSNRVVHVIRLLGGFPEHVRFFHTVDNAILRKRDVAGRAVKCGRDLRVVRVEALGRDIPMYDITTGTGDFVANGVISHNCYARPSHEYLGFSAGLDFESKIVVKPDAPRLLQDAFRKRNWVPTVIAISGNTDPYQPLERKLRITRGVLEVCHAHRNPVAFITKNHLITRDIDLLEEMAAYDLVHVTVSITSLRPEITAVMEPRTSRPAARLKTIRELAEHGIPVGVNVAPIIPGLTDEEMPAILKAAADHGAQYAGYTIVRLPGAVESLFGRWIHETFPDRANKVMARIRSIRGDDLGGRTFGRRMRGDGVWAELLNELFHATCTRSGLNQREHKLALHHFRHLTPGQTELF
ncbi:MAG TPA: PA0069 family radical SAM protein [Rhodothermales bacterium]|nr:PA0069 family radical SAM protein [Rhodothermales bacterium]